VGLPGKDERAWEERKHRIGQSERDVIDMSAFEGRERVSDARGAQRDVHLADVRGSHVLIALPDIEREAAESPQIVPVSRDHVVRRIRRPAAEHRVDDARAPVDRDEGDIDEERRPRRIRR